MQNFAGRVALITGSGSGMGQSHAALLAERGADVIVHDINQAGAEETAAMVRAQGRKALVLPIDITDTAAMAAGIARAEAEFGRIDVLINNAGISAERSGIDGVDEAWFARIFDIHVKGTFFTTKAVVPGMKQRRYGKIVNISSIWGLTGHHFGATYCAAKAAVLGLTKSWAKELVSYNINVNAVAPGGVMAGMQFKVDGREEALRQAKANPMGRWAEVVEMSYAVVFLASSEADFITGQVLSPNGGDTIVGI